MTFWGVVQIIAIFFYMIGYGMFFGCNVEYSATHGETELSDGYYDTMACLGGISFIVFIIAVIANHGLFFMK